MKTNIMPANGAPVPNLPEALHPSASHVPPDCRDGWNACHQAFADASTSRAFAIADESMFELLRCHCVAANDLETVLVMFDKSGCKARTLTEADPAIVEAFNWLKERGYVKIGIDNQGEHVVVLHQPGKE